MPNIQIIVDSASDLEPKFIEKYGIRVMPCHIETNKGSFLENVDFTADDLYAYVDAGNPIPKTSQITAIEWMNAYLDAFAAGKEDVIVITMNAENSGTNAAAKQGVLLLSEENPAAAEKLTVRVVDSTGFSVPIQMAIYRVMRLIERGASAREAEDWLNEWFSHQAILLGICSLTYAKKSGRLNTVAAFVGEVLGLKPIMLLHSKNTVVEKARGERAMINRLAQMYIEMAEDPKGDYVIAYGSADKTRVKLLVSAVKKLGGGSPLFVNRFGPCVGMNAGPETVGIGFRAKKAL